MNVNLTIREINELREVVDFIIGSLDEDHFNKELLNGIEAKLEEIVNVSRWEGINTLIPLGVKVLVKPDKGTNFFATRVEMADSYAPSQQKVVKETGEVVTLNLSLDSWTRHF